MAREEKRDMEARFDNTNVGREYTNTMETFLRVMAEIDSDGDPNAAAILTAAIVLQECANGFLGRADDLMKSVKKVGKTIESSASKLRDGIDLIGQEPGSY